MSEAPGEEVERGQEAPGALPRARRELEVLQPAQHSPKSANSLMHLQVFPWGIDLRLGYKHRAFKNFNQVFITP